MKNKIKTFLYGLLLSTASLGVCFFALAVPFQLFGEISSFGIKMLFLCEIIVYSVTALICLVIKDKSNQKKGATQTKADEKRGKNQKASGGMAEHSRLKRIMGCKKRVFFTTHYSI